MATVVPPPVLDRSLQMALMGFAQPIGQGLAVAGQRGMRQEDLAKLIAYQQAMQQYQQGISQPAEAGTVAGALEQGPLAGLRITEPVAPQFPQLQSQAGQQLGLQGIGQQLFQTPLQQAQAEYYRARALPEPATKVAGEVKIAVEGDGTGLPAGTSYQYDRYNRLQVISEPELLTEAKRKELELYGKRRRPEEVKERRLAFQKAQQDLRKAKQEFALATSPEEKANRKVELEQARETLRKTKEEIKQIGKPTLTRADIKFYVDRGFTPPEAKMLRDDFLGVKKKEPQTPKEIAMELSRWQTIKNKTREVGILGQFGKILDQETWDLAQTKITELRGRLAGAKGTVRVISPTGEHGTVPIGEWEEHRKRGFRKE